MTLPIINHNLGIEKMDREKIELLKRTICKGATDDEMELFLHACNRTKLDPFMRQIHPVKRYDATLKREVMSIQTGIDGYRLIAERTGNYMPGRECTFQYKDGSIFSATAYVKKLGRDGTWHEIPHKVYWNEYVAMTKEGKPTYMWRDKGHIMLGKCAEAGALRKAFPADLSGIYTKEEMEQADVSTIETVDTATKQEISLPEAASQPAIDEVISETEAQELESILRDDDPQYRKDLLAFYTISRKLSEPMTSFLGFPKKYMPGLMKAITKRREEKIKRMASGVEQKEMFKENI